MASGVIKNDGWSAPVELSIHNTNVFEKPENAFIKLRVNAKERMARIDVYQIRIKVARDPGTVGHIIADIPSEYTPLFATHSHGDLIDPDNRYLMNPIPLIASTVNGLISQTGAIGFKVGNLLSGYITWFY